MAIQNNKFTRQAEQNAANKRNLTGEEKINFDAQLVRLEEDIRRLKIEFDVFFNGSTKRPPYDTKNRVETIFKRLGDERSLTFAQRYQYNALLARYGSLRELWRRTMKGREEGRDAISVAQAALGRRTQPPEDKEENKTFTCTNLQRESATVEQLYNALIKAKTACGESLNDLSFTKFQQQLVTQTEKFKQATSCEKVSFEVGINNGTVVFKARAEK